MGKDQKASTRLSRGAPVPIPPRTFRPSIPPLFLFLSGGPQGAATGLNRELRAGLLGPIQVEELAARLVHALVGVRAEVVTLRL
jgi:hypothetical protein